MNTKRKSFDKGLSIQRVLTPKGPFKKNLLTDPPYDPPHFSSTNYLGNGFDISTPKSSIRSYSNFIVALENLIFKLDSNIKIGSEADILVIIEKAINALKNPTSSCDNCLKKSENIENLRNDLRAHQIEAIKEMEKIQEIKAQMKKYESLIKQKEKDLNIRESNFLSEKDWLEKKAREIEHMKKSLEIEKNGVAFERKKILEEQKEVGQKFKNLDGKFIKLNKQLLSTSPTNSSLKEKELQALQEAINSEKHEINLKNQYFTILAEDLSKQEKTLQLKENSLQSKEQELTLKEQLIQKREKELKDITQTLENTKQKLEEKDKEQEKIFQEKSKNLDDLEQKLKSQKKEMKNKIKILNTQLLKFDTIKKSIHEDPREEPQQDKPMPLLTKNLIPPSISDVLKHAIEDVSGRGKSSTPLPKSSSTSFKNPNTTEQGIKNNQKTETYDPKPKCISLNNSFLSEKKIDTNKAMMQNPFDKIINSKPKNPFFKSKNIEQNNEEDEQDWLMSPLDKIKRTTSSLSRSLIQDLHSEKPCENTEFLTKSLVSIENALEDKEQELIQRKKLLDKRETDCYIKEKKLEEQEKSLKSAVFYKQTAEDLQKDIQNLETFKKKYEDLSLSYESYIKKYEDLYESHKFYKKQCEDLQKSSQNQGSYENLIQIQQENQHYKQRCLELQQILQAKESEFEELSYLIDFTNDIQAKIQQNSNKEKELEELQHTLELQKQELEQTAETLQKIFLDLEVQKQTLDLEKELIKGEKESNEHFFRQETINLANKENELLKKYEASDDSESSECQNIFIKYTPKK
ncbi:hypothetical protein SteCoe_13774 [Stentor coeruleus]|uniref:Uncharacterized protein n=1 Tax=Stentor coeruleus TaxID=5963 RepID=A0A1R2C7M7_9CILI|nr:hypothetical protein SteCoe_13774 [Stentor coeruleus]